MIKTLFYLLGKHGKMFYIIDTFGTMVTSVQTCSLSSHPNQYPRSFSADMI